MTERIRKTEAEWKAQLTPEQYAVTREKATERPFTGVYHDCTEGGMYRCVCCGAALFSSADKYDAGCGWPSYTRPAEPANVRTQMDHSHGMRRIEVLCDACDAHLGHVFDDGPGPGGKRFCINSAALKLEAQDPPNG